MLNSLIPRTFFFFINRYIFDDQLCFNKTFGNLGRFYVTCNTTYDSTSYKVKGSEPFS